MQLIHKRPQYVNRNTDEYNTNQNSRQIVTQLQLQLFGACVYTVTSFCVTLGIIIKVTNLHIYSLNITAQRSLYVPHSGHYMYRTVVTIRTAQRSLYVPHSGHYTYRTVVTICTTLFNTEQSHVLPTQCIYVFCVDLRTNSDYFPIKH